MRTIRPLTTVLSLSALLIAGLLLTGCGNGVGVSQADAATSAGAAAPPGATPTPPPATPAPPAAPVALTGTPAASVTVGQNYMFQPAVSQGGGVVTFKIQGQPAWAAFDPDTGVLTGKPATANEGTTGSITITGTNGSTSASIGPFTILVKAPTSAPGTGSATLSWIAPTQNTDGTPITNLAGYHIYYGVSASQLTTTITVSDVTETSYVVGGLAPGTYYFAVVAYNSAGMDSPESNVDSKTI
jgi:fibronectin type III domain protein